MTRHGWSKIVKNQNQDSTTAPPLLMKYKHYFEKCKYFSPYMKDFVLLHDSEYKMAENVLLKLIIYKV